MLNPASWAEGYGPFVTAVGLGDKMGLVDKISEASLPPDALRQANHYWRINATLEAGYMLVVSDQLPMCHITGGGNADLQPAAEAVLASPEFASRWEWKGEHSQGDMASSKFRHREEKAFSIVISRARQPGLRTDRVQVVATAIYEP